MTQFIVADCVSLEDVVNIFNAGYEGYIMPVNVTADWMSANLNQNDTKLALSRIALVDGEPAGICLLAKRGAHGWINALGVATPYRRQGIGRELMMHILDVARENGITQLDLEYIIGNDRAGALYESLGFEKTRKLLLLTRDPQDIPSPTPSGYEIKAVEIDEALAHFDSFHPSPNPWQRSKEALLKSPNLLDTLVAVKDGATQAYLITRTVGENLIINDAASANNDALLALLHHLHSQHSQAIARYINLPAHDPTLPVFTQFGYQETMAQYEMRLMLSGVAQA